jgi:transcriptional regulator with XRE-family HTH domain
MRLLGAVAVGAFIALRPVSGVAAADVAGGPPTQPGASGAEIIVAGGPAPSVQGPPAASPSATPGEPLATPSAEPTVAPSPSASPTASPSSPADPTPEPSPSDPASASPMPEPSVSPSPSAEPLPTVPPVPSDSPLPSVVPSPTPIPTVEPLPVVPSPSAGPSVEPLPSASPGAGATLPVDPIPVEAAPTASPVESGLLETTDPAAPTHAPAAATQPSAVPMSGSSTGAGLAAWTVLQASAAPAVSAAASSSPSPAASPAPAPEPHRPIADWARAESESEARSHPLSLLASATSDLPRELALAAVPAVAPAVAHSAVQVALDFGKSGSGWAGAVVFNIWLRRQLRERRMSQRQLAMLSGVDHSTISRLLRGDRAPTLETATKLAHALRQLAAPEEAPVYFDRLTEATIFPTQRVEAALRGDEELDEIDVRHIMHAYLVLRARRRQAKRVNGGPVGEVGALGP